MATSKRVSFNGRDYKVEISGPVAKPDSFSVYSIEEIGGIFGEGTVGWGGPGRTESAGLTLAGPSSPWSPTSHAPQWWRREERNRARQARRLPETRGQGIPSGSVPNPCRMPSGIRGRYVSLHVQGERLQIDRHP